MLRLVEKIKKENQYSGSDWNYEITYKYILEIDDVLIEAGQFYHYYNDLGKLSLKKEVIELPSSFGCPIRCSYCASSNIKKCQALSANQIVEIFEFIYKKNVVSDHMLLVTMTGIGDYTLNYVNIDKAILAINRKYRNTVFTISSCIWNKESIARAEELAKKVDIRAINITYVTHDPIIIKKLIPYYKEDDYNISKIVLLFENSSLTNLRINYVMIHEVNDNNNDFDLFVKYMDNLKERIVIRISKMNITHASRKAGLLPPDLERMNVFKNHLEKFGFNAYLFYSFVDDNMNCGQLLTEKYEESCS